MASEGASMLLQSNSNDDLDLELLDGSLEFEQGRMGRKGRFGLISRLALAATGAVAVGFAASAPSRTARQPQTGSDAFLKEFSEVQAASNSLETQVPAQPVQSSLVPVESMHDGNVCDANEEFYGGLCYKKCSLLTNGDASIRTSSWTCCESHPCTLNQKGSIGTGLLCNGYDVNGQGGCPHKPGACLLDEELHLGICYKKCSMLTEGKFPFRIAAATCCKTQGIGCLDIFTKTKTSDGFNVGGGSGDHDPSTPNAAHPPDEQLTEASGAPTTAATTAQSTSPVPQFSHVKPAENLHDGNVCDDEEELYGGVCYKKCSLLTNDEAPIRTSSWTCCKNRPCSLWNQRGSVGHTVFCNGFDVAADGSCPHKPGACLVNEEMLLGVCYEKCSLLTNGAFPNRLTAATCCKTSGFGCLNPMNVMTSDALDVGGGGTNNAEDSQAHLPDESLTEAHSSAVNAPAQEVAAQQQVQTVAQIQAFPSVTTGVQVVPTQMPQVSSTQAQASVDSHASQQTMTLQQRFAGSPPVASGAALQTMPLQQRFDGTPAVASGAALPQAPQGVMIRGLLGPATEKHQIPLGSALPFRRAVSAPMQKVVEPSAAQEAQAQEAFKAQAAVAAAMKAMK